MSLFGIDGSFVAGLPPWLLVLGGGILGAILGSFIGALVTRWPDGRSVLSGRSSCDSCGAQLAWHELFPLLSFLLSKGRCRHCNAVIGRVHFSAELLAALIGAAAFALLPPITAFWAALLGWLLLPLLLLDFRHLWLPTGLILLLALAGLIRLLLMGDLEATGLSLLAAAFAYAALELIRVGYRKYRGIEGMGAGDPRLLGAIMLWIEPFQLPFLLLMASLFGLALVLLYRRDVTERAKLQIPFGSCLAVAAWLLFLASEGAFQ